MADRLLLDKRLRLPGVWRANTCSSRLAASRQPLRACKKPVAARVRNGQGFLATRLGATSTSSSSSSSGQVELSTRADVPAAASASTAMDMNELLQSPGEPPQALIDDQLAHLIDTHPPLDDLEEVVYQLPVIKAELADQQQLLVACNQFLEDMAERHMNLLLQQQATQQPSDAAAGAATPTDLAAHSQLEQHLQQVTVQLQEQQQETLELRKEKDALNKQLRIVTMEREDLRQQLQDKAEAVIEPLEETLRQVADLQDRLSDAEQKLTAAMDSNSQLTDKLHEAQSEAAAAKASALAATSSASAATYAQLQDVTAKAVALEAQLAASQQHSSSVGASNKALQRELQQAHAQGKRLLAMNRQLMQHAEVLAGQYKQQQQVVSALQEDKAALAAKLGRLYILLQEMQAGQQRQQQLQVKLLRIVAEQQHLHNAGEVGAAVEHGDNTPGASEAQDRSTGNALVKAVSGAVLMLPVVGQLMLGSWLH